MSLSVVVRLTWVDVCSVQTIAWPFVGAPAALLFGQEGGKKRFAERYSNSCRRRIFCYELMEPSDAVGLAFVSIKS